MPVSQAQRLATTPAIVVLSILVVCLLTGLNDIAIARAQGTGLTIKVGNHPTYIAYEPSDNMLFVSNHDDGTVSVIDVLTNQVVNTITLSHYSFSSQGYAEGITLYPSINTVLVSDMNGILTYINASTAAETKLTGSANLGAGYNGEEGVGPLAMDSSTAAVYWLPTYANTIQNSIPNVLYWANLTTAYCPGGCGYGQIAMGVKGFRQPPLVGGIAIDASTHHVYVANGPGTLSVISSLNNVAVANVTVGSLPVGVAVNSRTHLVYVTNHNSNTTSVVNGLTNSVAATIRVGIHPTGVAVNETNNTVYVSSPESNSVWAINGTTNSVIGVASTNGGARLSGTGGEQEEGPWGVAVVPSNGDVYVTNYSSNTVSVIPPLAFSTKVSSSTTSTTSVTTESSVTTQTSSSVPVISSNSSQSSSSETGVTTLASSSFTSQSSSASSSTASGSSGIPEFPLQTIGVLALTFLVIASYIVARGRVSHHSSDDQLQRHQP